MGYARQKRGRPTLERPVDARQRQPRVTQLQHDVRACQQRGEQARELCHVSGVP
jgi:hypothetical protein